MSCLWLSEFHFYFIAFITNTLSTLLYFTKLHGDEGVYKKAKKMLVVKDPFKTKVNCNFKSEVITEFMSILQSSHLPLLLF